MVGINMVGINAINVRLATLGFKRSARTESTGVSGLPGRDAAQGLLRNR